MPELLTALKDRDEYVRSAAAGALGQIRDVAVVPELLSVLKDRDEYVRSAAAKALGQIGDEAVVRQLAEFLQETERDSGKGRKICEDVVRILEQISTPEALEAVEQWRRDRQEKNTS